MKILKIDPSIKISKVLIFKIIGYGLPITALTFSIIIGFNSELTRDFSYEGFNTGFFTVFRVPAAILAACITILGLISTIHRSAQISLQIDKTTEQNVFSNFYKHREEYIHHLKELKNEVPEYIKNELTEKVIRQYYKSTYPKNHSSNFTTKPNIEWINNLDKELIRLCYLLA